MEQATFFIVPTLEVVTHEFLALLTCFREGGVRASVHPTARTFDSDDFGCDALKKNAIMAHHQDGALATANLFFQPRAGGNVEVVVGFVQEQHVGARVQQQIKNKALAFAAGEFTNKARCKVGHGCLHTALCSSRPLRFEVVATEVTPVAESFCICHAVVFAGHHCFLCSE